MKVKNSLYSLFLVFAFVATGSGDILAHVKEQVAQATKEYAASVKKLAPKPSDLVNLATVVPGIVLDIKYATDDNFTGKTVYTQAACYLRRAAAEQLVAVQAELKTKGLGIKVFDGYRPYDVQGKFWELCPDPRYVADPAKGSKHNRGAAIDLTLIDLKTGKELFMPSAFDDFTEKAHRTYESMAPEAAANCKLLEDAMTKRGFTGLPTEWWHFDFDGWQDYPLLNVSFEVLAVS